MPAPFFAHWRKSTRSNPGGNCVEVGFTDDATHAGVRDTKDRDAGTLAVTAGRWSSFLDAVKSGRLDLS